VTKFGGLAVTLYGSYVKLARAHFHESRLARKGAPSIFSSRCSVTGYADGGFLL